MASRTVRGVALAAAGMSVLAPDAGAVPTTQAAPCRVVASDDPTGLYDPNKRNVRGTAVCSPVRLSEVIDRPVREAVMKAVVQTGAVHGRGTTLTTVSRPVDGDLAYIPPTPTAFTVQDKASTYVCSVIEFVDVSGRPGVWVPDASVSTTEEIECILAILQGC